MEDERMARIEEKLDRLLKWAGRLDPLVTLAETFAASSSVKLMGKLQRDKTGKK